MSVTLFKKSVACTAVVVGLAIPVLSNAAQSPDDRYFDKRFYVGAGAGVSQLEPRKTTDSLAITDKNDTSFSLLGGYDLSPRFSLDGYVSKLGEADVSFIGTPVGGVEYTVYGLSLISYLFNAGSPYSDSYDDDGLYQREGLSTYVRMGVGGMSNSSDVGYDRDYSTHFAAGLGVEYGWSNGVALRAELSSYDTDAQQLSISALKRLGDASYASMAAAAPVLAAVASVEAEPEAVVEVPAAPVLGRPIVLFAFNQTRVTEDYFDELERLAALMQQYPEVKVQIDGHSDWIGDATYNMHLSERRAVSVESFLAERGISSDRMNTTGYGEEKPVADNNTLQGRALNRRVEIWRMP